MAWTFNGTEALFIQIANRLRRDILFGKYQPDEQIPPVRQLAFEAAVNPNTMQKSLALLEEEGLVHSRGTVGRFITSDPKILESAREKVKREAVRSWIKDAKTLGIDTTDLIAYINNIYKEDNNL